MIQTSTHKNIYRIQNYLSERPLRKLNSTVSIILERKE